MSSRFAFFASALLAALFGIFMLLPKGWLAQEDVGHSLFFIYGTRLNIRSFEAKIGHAGTPVPAYLPSYRLVFQAKEGMEFGVPNLQPEANSSVPGAIYNLSKAQAEALDRAFGAPNFYRRIRVSAIAEGGRQISAETYVLSGDAYYKPPSAAILESTLEGLRQFGYQEMWEYAVLEAAFGAYQEGKGGQLPANGS